MNPTRERIAHAIEAQFNIPGGLDSCNGGVSGYIKRVTADVDKAFAEDTTLAKLAAAEARVGEALAGYQREDTDARPCPGCDYRDGVFHGPCKLHARVRELDKQLAYVDSERLMSVNVCMTQLARHAALLGRLKGLEAKWRAMGDDQRYIFAPHFQNRADELAAILQEYGQ